MAGFSNRAAQLTLLGGGLLFALWTRGWGVALATNDAHRDARHDARTDAADEALSASRTHVVWRWTVPAAAVAIVLATCLYIWYWASAMGPFDEAIYFLDRFSNQLAGGHVFRDFTFDYGPLLYYPSWWIAAVLRIPVGHAYYLFWTAEWVLGTVLLWNVIGALRARPLHRAVTFIAVLLAWYTSIVDQGAQYTPFRFIVTSSCALWVYRLWQRRAVRGGATAFVPPLSAALFCFTLLLLFSPEQGIGFAMATLLFFAIGVRQRAAVLPLAAFAAACTVVFAVAKHLGLLQSLFTFAGGAFDLPVLAGPQTLFLIPMLVGVACLVVQAFRSGESARPELYLVALALVAIPAAFGRADAGHIFINTMPALIVLTLALLQRPVLRGVVVAGWAVYLAGAFAGHGRHGLNVLMHSWPRVEKMPDAAQLPPSGVRLWAPIRYFSYLDGQFGPRVLTGEYYGFDLVFPGLAEKKIEELRAHPRDLVVVPLDYAGVCAGASVAEQRVQLHNAFQSLWTPRLHAVPNVKEPLCRYIRTHYVASPYRVPREEYRVLQPRAFPIASMPAVGPGETACGETNTNDIVNAKRLP